VSNGNVVPASVYSALANSNTLSEISIGSTSYTPPNADWDTAAIWLSVYDLDNLNQVASDLSTDGSTVPSDISQYVGNSEYFLYAVSTNAWASVAPQGDLYTLLQKVGSGAGLAQIEQIYATIGTGFLGTFTYILGAAMDESVPGFETGSFFTGSVLTMGFLPITVDGQTVYAPVQAGG